jgi:DNA-damage-inducible protein D
VEQANLRGEGMITHEHVKNNESVRDMLGQRGIRPEKLAAEEDLQKLERRVKLEEKKLARQTKALPPREDKKDKP